MPGAGGFVDQLQERAVAADQVVGADLALRVGQRRQGFRRVVVGGLVQDDEIRPALVEVR